jgi:hypothetical protein
MKAAGAQRLLPGILPSVFWILTPHFRFFLFSVVFFADNHHQPYDDFAAVDSIHTENFYVEVDASSLWCQ